MDVKPITATMKNTADRVATAAVLKETVKTDCVSATVDMETAMETMTPMDVKPTSTPIPTIAETATLIVASTPSVSPETADVLLVIKTATETQPLDANQTKTLMTTTADRAETTVETTPIVLEDCVSVSRITETATTTTTRTDAKNFTLRAMITATFAEMNVDQTQSATTTFVSV